MITVGLGTGIGLRINTSRMEQMFNPTHHQNSISKYIFSFFTTATNLNSLLVKLFMKIKIAYI